nr:MerR family transcriptional regulator [Nocardioides sp. InS609-2]
MSRRPAIRIGELSERTGVPPRMLRYYEQQGLVQPSRADNGYREYAVGDVDRVQTVRSLVRSGMPTKLIAAVVDMQAGAAGWSDNCSATLAGQLAEELRSIEDKLSCLTLSRNTLRDYLARTGLADVLAG